MPSQETTGERGLQYKASLIGVYKYFKAICIKLYFINMFCIICIQKDCIKKTAFIAKKGD